MGAELQARCESVQAALLPPTILMAEEVAVADALAALAFVASSGLGPRSVEAGEGPPDAPVGAAGGGVTPTWRDIEREWETRERETTERAARG